jgi:DNA-directed RNA polymerase subunit RPC12/RpoP
MNRQVYVCGKCGRTADTDHVRGWLIGRSKNAEDQANGILVIRCPQHISGYALRKAEGGRNAIR